MTREDWAKLNDKEKRMKVAELCGWKQWWFDKKNGWTDEMCRERAMMRDMPDYLHDLNVMYEVVETLRTMDGSEWWDFGKQLSEICCSFMNCVNASAADRAEAFVLTLTAHEPRVPSIESSIKPTESETDRSIRG